MSLSKGVALVTGSAQGIGRAIAIRLAQDGFDVALNDLPAKASALEDLAAELERSNAPNLRTCIVAGDVSSEDEVKRMIDITVDVLGGLDVVSGTAVERMTIPESWCHVSADGRECRNCCNREYLDW